MKNLIVVGNLCNKPQMTYNAIKKVSIENNVSSICVGAQKDRLNSVEWQAHFYANHNDLHVFDASINIPKRKPFALPVSQMTRIFNKAESWGTENIMLVLHNGKLSDYFSVIKKAEKAHMKVITIKID